MARVLVLEPFLGGSHQAWAEGWRARSRHDVELLGLEGRHWRWRMRGGAVTLAREVREADLGPFDVVVASNMLDLASFRGLSDLVGATWIQYFHENQLTYPRQEGESLDTGLAWMQWRGLVAADEIWCNSTFQRRELLDGLDRLLDAAPDHGHEPERDALPAKLRVIHPGVDVAALRAGERRANPRPLVVSNQRWHHDKDVGAVLRSLRRLAERGLDFEVAVVGDHEGGEAESLAPVLADLGDRVVARGLVDADTYRDLLRRADVVVSAARGENFGIAIVEAIAAGAWPVLPDALAYPEVIPADHHAACLYPAGGLGRRLGEVIEAVAAGATAPTGLASAMAAYDWSVIAAAMDDRIDELRAN
ncbi:MAG: DUF3524 domain-containing protein [Actinomycetota bacterium]